MIKDNHIQAAGGIKPAVEKIRGKIGHTMKIEVEVSNFEQLDEALAVGADIIMLDNMSLEMMTDAVKRIDGKAISEASGGITLETVKGCCTNRCQCDFIWGVDPFLSVT